MNESLCTNYRGLWNKCKKKGMGKLNVIICMKQLIKIKILENGPVKPVTHPADFKKIFPVIDIDHMQFRQEAELFARCSLLVTF